MTETVESTSLGLQRLLFVPAPTPVTVLILARDEADVIGTALAAIRPSLTAGDRLCVVADHCRDATAAVARRAGAEVFIRGDGRAAGKGEALRWWLERTAGAPGDEGILILDADSRPGPGLIEGLRARLSRGEVAVQAMLEPLLAGRAAVPILAGFSETVEQQVFDALKASWGWPVRLHGTGMGFKRGVLSRAAARLGTAAEDAELTILLAGWGVPITLAREVCVVDPKPSDARGAARQRARWFRGQAEILRRHQQAILSLVRRGPPGWMLLTSVFLQPKSVFIPLKLGAALGAVAAWTTGLGSGWMVPAAVLSASLAVDLAGMVAGLALTRQRAPVIRALLAWPIFLAVWLSAFPLTLVSRGRWERARPAAPRGSSPRRGQV